LNNTLAHVTASTGTNIKKAPLVLPKIKEDKNLHVVWLILKPTILRRSEF
jgi:hypothetical protein